MEPGDLPGGNAPRLSLGGMLGPTKPQTKAQKAAAVKTAAERLSANVVGMANFTALRFAGPQALMLPEERATIETTLQEILEDSETFAKQSKAVSPFVLLAASALWLLRVGTLWAGKRAAELKAKAEAKASKASVAAPQYEPHPFAPAPPPPPFDEATLLPLDPDELQAVAAAWEQHDAESTTPIYPTMELFSNGSSQN